MPDVGALVGEKYRLLRILGRGGMGAVYEAVHEQIGKAVAVKVLLPQAVSQAEVVARFQQEAQAASAAGHNGIIDIYDVGLADDGAPYLVMELLQGRSLGEELAARGHLEVHETAYIACQVLSALSAAHQAGIVHRDLKPENLFLADVGASLPEVKLLDFGISRIIVPGSPEAATRWTQSGTVMGTPHYMSPEQAAGKRDVDHRTDLYSMAVILYQCLTARLPHDGENYNALMASIISDEPWPPRHHTTTLPEAVEAVILRGLCKERVERYGDAAAMYYDLRPFVDASAVASLRKPTTPGGVEVLGAAFPEAVATDMLAEEPTQPQQVSEPPTTAEPLASGGKPRHPAPLVPPPTVMVEPEEAPRKRRPFVLLFIALSLVFAVATGVAAVIVFGGDTAPGESVVEPATVTDPESPVLAPSDGVTAPLPSLQPVVDGGAGPVDASVRPPARASGPVSPRPVAGDSVRSTAGGDYGQEVDAPTPRPRRPPRAPRPVGSPRPGSQERDYGHELD